MTEEQDFDDADIKRRMDGAISALQSEFGGLRTGRASSSLLDPIMVDAYGASMPLNQVATVSVPEPRMISVQVWDKSQVQIVEKAIRNSGLGLNPVTEGTLLRLPIPELNEERRLELARVAAKYAEQARVAVRNVRRDGMDKLKRMEKAGDMGEDEHKAWADEVQALTDAAVAEIDRLFAAKEKEITQV
jgi:ribosome recycling factor